LAERRVWNCPNLRFISHGHRITGMQGDVIPRPAPKRPIASTG
jgi:hypothetical protein